MAREARKDFERLNVRGEIAKRRGKVARMVDTVGDVLAHPAFFLGVVTLHAVWVVLNLPVWPYVPWDPYPFTFLATVASVEAPFIALLVLMRQFRDQRVNELRQEILIQLSLQAERELTMLVRLATELEAGLGVPSEQGGEELEDMKQILNAERLLEHIKKHLDETEGREPGTTP